MSLGTLVVTPALSPCVNWRHNSNSEPPPVPPWPHFRTVAYILNGPSTDHMDDCEFLLHFTRRLNFDK